MRAEEAKAILDDAYTYDERGVFKVNYRDLNLVLDKVKEAAMDGRSHANFDYIYKGVILLLKDLGYRVFLKRSFMYEDLYLVSFDNDYVKKLEKYKEL
jgi:hypothetical protein